MREFWAVTQSRSIYYAVVDQNGKDKVVLTKGGGRVRVGRMLIIRECLVLEGLEDGDSGGDCLTTNYVVALFDSEREAIDCVEQSDLKIYDRRWRLQTKHVMAQLNNNHPCFEVVPQLLQTFLRKEESWFGRLAFWRQS